MTGSMQAFNIELMVGGGFREDCFDWSISDPQIEVDILSELQWKDLCMYDTIGMFKGSLLGFEVKLKGNYGKILSGGVRDSDYLASGRNMEYSRSRHHVRGHAYDVSAAIGYRFPLFVATIEPLVGWSHHELQVTNFNGRQVINLFGNTGDIPGVNGSYRSRWDGPWAGIDASCDLLCDWRVYGTFEYHWAHFRGTGDWNLRTDFIKDFQQRAFGNGFLFTIGTQYELFCQSYLGLEYSLMHMSATHGLDRIFTIFGNGVTVLREVNWHTMNLVGTLSFLF